MEQTILERLIAKNFTVISFARGYAVNRSTIYQCLDGLGSRRIRIDIAILLKKSPIELWPGNDADSLMLDTALYLMKSTEQSSVIKDEAVVCSVA